MIKRFGLACLSAAMLLPLSTQAAHKPISAQDKLSYAMGYSTGQALRSHHVDVNTSVYQEAMNAGLLDSKASLSKQEMGEVLQTFQEQQVKKMAQEREQSAQSNLKSGQQYLAKHKKLKGVKTFKDGLQYQVIQSGKGQSPKMSDTVTADYEGKLIDGTVFDSSYQRHEPMSFPVRGVIKGWQEALTHMKPGAVWKVVIPADLAYGEAGVPGTDIGPNEVLVFKIHLISVSPTS